MQFFVLRVASNKEDRVREALLRKVKIEGVEDVVGRILVPTERVRSMKGGVRKESDRKLYPGYVFIELTLVKNGMIPEKVWFLIKETDGVGDFIGSNGKPTPMSPKDQAKMLEEAERPEDAPGLKTGFQVRGVLGALGLLEHLRLVLGAHRGGLAVGADEVPDAVGFLDQEPDLLRDHAVLDEGELDEDV